jgi:hypothetical protein
MKYVLIIIALLSQLSIAAQNYQNGDIVFKNLDCGALCDAIEAVTSGHAGNSFSHIGLVYIQHDSVFVIEAIGNNVTLTPIKQFEARSKHHLVQARLKPAYKKLIPDALAFALLQIGKPYDDAFLYNNGKYYCSELLYDAFAFANKGKPFFVLEPMTFKQPSSETFFPVWISYYAELNMPIPEGKLGINPGGISKSDKIEIITQ